MPLPRAFLLLLHGTLFLLTFAGGTAVAIEEPRFRSVVRDGDIELRAYVPYLVAETEVAGELGPAGNAGFRILADFIFGNNRAKAKIAMTAPVEQGRPESEKIAMTAPVGQQEKDGRWRVSFAMPAAYTRATLPEPVDPRVTIREVPARTVAVLRFSGTWSAERFEEKHRLLATWLRKHGYTPRAAPVFARFNPPWTPWFLRRNEVQVEVEPAPRG